MPDAIAAANAALSCVVRFKTLPAHGQANYSIPQNFTGGTGSNFRALLSSSQEVNLESAVAASRANLTAIVTVREAISAELRKFLNGETPDYGRVIGLSQLYGEFDGTVSYLYATAFSNIYPTLSQYQLDTISSWRYFDPNDPTGPFLYANVDSSMTADSVAAQTAYLLG